MTVWTVAGLDRCPRCHTMADVTCQADRHRCPACGTDRGPCDRALAVHHHQPSLF